MTTSNVVPFDLPSDFSPDVAWAGARELIQGAVQAEVSGFITEQAHLPDERGRQRLVRHCFLPERKVMTGTGKVWSRAPSLRKAKSVEDLKLGRRGRRSRDLISARSMI